MQVRCYLFFQRLLVAAALLLGARAAGAQATVPPRGFDFLTITIIKSPYRADCRMLLTPAFQGTKEVKLEEEYYVTNDKYRENLQRNTALLNQTLSDLSVAGWELVATPAVQEGPPNAPAIARYLLRKAKG